MPPVQPLQSIAGRRVRLGPIDPADVPAYTAWINDPGIQPFLNRPWPVTQEEESRRVGALITAPDAMGFAIRLLEGDRLIGRAAIWNIHRINKSGLFTIFIGARSEQSKGLGREATALTTVYAMERLALNRLELEVFDYNERAIRCYEALGFVREGVRRQARFHEGAWHDGIQMSILASEWHDGLRARFLEHVDQERQERQEPQGTAPGPPKGG